MSRKRRVIWSLLSTGAAAGTAVLVRRALEGGWERRVGPAPRNPGITGTRWRDALVWAAVTGLIAGVGRMLARQGAAAAWRRAAGSRPPVKEG